MGAEPLNEHLRLEQMAALLDRELSGEELRRAEAHLASCDECRREVVEVSRTLHSSRSRKPWVALATLAAAAAVVGVLLLAPGARELGSPEAAAVRADGGALVDEGIPEIEVVSPTSAARIARESPLFVWKSNADRAIYRFTLTDESGDVLWSESTTDTVLSLTSEVILQPSTTYFWHVDALLSDGSSATTGFHELRTSE